MSDQNTKTAQVACAGVSYFTREAVLDANGATRRTQSGEEIYTEIRHEAARGEIVELTTSEFDRLDKYGALREPSDAPLFPDRPYATPFGIPVPTGEGDERAAFAGPVMGHPAPVAADGLTDQEFLNRDRSAALTPEQAAALEAQADGKVDANGKSTFNIEDSTVEETTEFLQSEKPNADATVALAGDDPVLAQKLVEAELARPSGQQRSTVVERLEAVANSDGDGDEEETS